MYFNRHPITSCPALASTTVSQPRLVPRMTVFIYELIVFRQPNIGQILCVSSINHLVCPYYGAPYIECGCMGGGRGRGRGGRSLINPGHYCQLNCFICLVTIIIIIIIGSIPPVMPVWSFRPGFRALIDDIGLKSRVKRALLSN